MRLSCLLSITLLLSGGCGGPGATKGASVGETIGSTVGTGVGTGIGATVDATAKTFKFLARPFRPSKEQ